MKENGATVTLASGLTLTYADGAVDRVWGWS
jgi:hypothetical protein